jgi:flagellar motor switch protein FliN/FliY
MSSPADQDLVFDIPLTVAMEIGRTRLTIREFLKLAAGSVVELDRPAGEPLDILVNGRLISRGEVVAINDRYGIRFTDVVNADGVMLEQMQ